MKRSPVIACSLMISPNTRSVASQGMRFGNGEKVSGRSRSILGRSPRRDSLKPFGDLRIPSRSALVVGSPRRTGESDVKRHAIRTIVFLGAFLSVILPVVQAQGKNEIGLVIGATVTPGRNFASGSTPSASFDSSLALGAEYDHRALRSHRAALYGGVDFLASPLDVKVSNPTAEVIGQYTYVFLTPHVRVKFNPDGELSPWLSFGGGYARFLEKKPTGVPSFVPGTNTGTFVFAPAWTRARCFRFSESLSDFARKCSISIPDRRTTIKRFGGACRTTWYSRVVC
jgi:hypothetical protein